MPYYDKGRKRWIGQTYLDERTPSGRQVKKTKMFLRKREAIAWELDQSLPEKERTYTICLADLATNYLDDCKRRYSDKTYDEKCLTFRELFQSLDPEMKIVDVEKEHIRLHLNGICDEVSGNAANKRRKNLVAAWNWGMQNMKGFPVYNPMMVQRYPETRSARYVPSEEDFWKVYNVVSDQQDRVMLLAYLHTAARRTELFRLLWDDVDIRGRRIKLHTRKRKDGSEEFDWIPMTEELTHALLGLKTQSNSELVFPNQDTGKKFTKRRRWMAGLCELADVKPFGLHAVRHLTASILVAADTPLIDIQAVLRHKNITTTERYLHRLVSVRGSMRVLENRQIADVRGSKPRKHPAHLKLVKGKKVVNA